tara:strand:- start:1043 stop:1201 length:159 start_codon:yes stop_codon:yes gene_type:complete
MTDHINTKLYTTEASKSKEKVAKDLKVPDPPIDIAMAILEEEEEGEENSADS